jgi:hypothetical protein
MSTQEFVIGPDEHMCLAVLRRKHRELGFSGRCKVKFDPCHFTEVLDLPGFVSIHQYRYTMPEDQREIGLVEVFRLVPIGPVDYAVYNSINT